MTTGISTSTTTTTYTTTSTTTDTTSSTTLSTTTPTVSLSGQEKISQAILKSFKPLKTFFSKKDKKMERKIEKKAKKVKEEAEKLFASWNLGPTPSSSSSMPNSPKSNSQYSLQSSIPPRHSTSFNPKIPSSQEPHSPSPSPFANPRSILQHPLPPSISPFPSTHSASMPWPQSLPSPPPLGSQPIQHSQTILTSNSPIYTTITNTPTTSNVTTTQTSAIDINSSLKVFENPVRLHITTEDIQEAINKSRQSRIIYFETQNIETRDEFLKLEESINSCKKYFLELVDLEKQKEDITKEIQILEDKKITEQLKFKLISINEKIGTIENDLSNKTLEIKKSYKNLVTNNFYKEKEDKYLIDTSYIEIYKAEFIEFDFEIRKEALLNIISNRMKYKEELITFLDSYKPKIISDFFSSFRGNIDSVDYGISILDKTEGHHGGKKVSIIHFYYRDPTTNQNVDLGKIVYKPRNAELDTKVIELFGSY